MGPPAGHLLGAPFVVHAAGEAGDILPALRLLAAAGVPALAAARGHGDPWLILAGPAALPNPEPAAAVFDAIVVGEPPASVTGLAEAWRAARPHGREAVAAAWLTCPGIYVPSAYRPAYREDGVLDSLTAAPGAPLPVPARREFAPPAVRPTGRPGLRRLAAHLWTWDEDRRGRPRGVTAVLGAAREPLRRPAGVPLTDEEVERLLDQIAASGAAQVELEFTLGLPGETDADADAIVTLVKRLRHRVLHGGRGAGRPPEIVPVVSAFLPQPWTPAQWAPLAEVRDLARRHKDLARALGKVGNVSLLHDVPKWAYMQAVLGRGDRRMARLFELALETHGDWAAACRRWVLNADFFVYRWRDGGETFPWDHLDLGLSKEDLREAAEARGLLGAPPA